MNNELLKVSIMGREFQINCPEQEREEIQLAAVYLDDKIQEIKTEGKVIDSERVAMIAALKITHELLSLRCRAGFDIEEFKRRIAALKKKIDEAITGSEG